MHGCDPYPSRMSKVQNLFGLLLILEYADALKGKKIQASSL